MRLVLLREVEGNYGGYTICMNFGRKVSLTLSLPCFFFLSPVRSFKCDARIKTAPLSGFQTTQCFPVWVNLLGRKLRFKKLKQNHSELCMLVKWLFYTLAAVGVSLSSLQGFQDHKIIPNNTEDRRINKMRKNSSQRVRLQNRLFFLNSLVFANSVAYKPGGTEWTEGAMSARYGEVALGSYPNRGGPAGPLLVVWSGDWGTCCSKLHGGGSNLRFMAILWLMPPLSQPVTETKTKWIVNTKAADRSSR